MAEAGCVRDLAVQNLEVQGNVNVVGTFMGRRNIDNSLINVVAGTSVSLARDQSGTLFTIDGTAANVITLPTVDILNVGCTYEFLVTTAVGAAVTTTFVLPGAGVSNFYASIIQTDATAAVDPTTSDVAGDTLTLVFSTAVGSRVRLTVVTDDGTNSVVMAEVHSPQLATVG
jgi:hypothetical protein